MKIIVSSIKKIPTIITVIVFISTLANYFLLDLGIGDSYFSYLFETRYDCQNSKDVKPEGKYYIHETGLFIKKPYIDYLLDYFRKRVYQVQIETGPNTFVKSFKSSDQKLHDHFIKGYFSENGVFGKLYRLDLQFDTESQFNFKIRRSIYRKLGENECLLNVSSQSY
jgi:hypothetical protein